MVPVLDTAWSGGQRSMPKYKVGETVIVDGRKAKIVWFRENANEIEAMDEYIVEFEDQRREFVISSTLAEKLQAIHNREHNGDACYGKAS